MKHKGAIAAGHPETANAAAAVLEEGGNAFDAALAGLCAACVAEPVLASLGGGGFLLARTAAGQTTLYDFFAQTPKVRRAGVDFSPILADFGDAQQEFHIGRGSMATPGVVMGLFEAHKDLGAMGMARIVEPAVALARDGVRINRLQAYIFEVVGKIYSSNAACRAVYGSRANPGRLLEEGETLVLPEFAHTLEALAAEGADLFYRGDMARWLAADCESGGGHLTRADLEGYRVVRRAPLELDFHGARLFTNPPPSTGGILIAFALELLKEAGLEDAGFGSSEHLRIVANAMALTNKARLDSRLHEAAEDGAETLLDPGFLETYRRQVLGRPASLRGTTHISVIDAAGNAASLTVSNGEGAAYIIPSTGVMMNNMLGEEDINPHGFHQWPQDTRMCSMMAPSLLLADRGGNGGVMAALGSGGSNRIRTAIMQVLLNLLEFGMNVEEAVAAPRLHFEDGLLNLEDGFAGDVVDALGGSFPETKVWSGKNLFFGGVHSVIFDSSVQSFEGAGDERRGGVTLLV